ncbi:hypothetical protein [Arthrobacter polaris]|uniref:hypothetical protein n=1 Tax=Arthrobacter polaris TaxID=2813727 RepID=UPI001F21E499|nr:hypothetical protein [Arthrobacter polaris]UIK88714.1 hypothetical protein J0916_15635 [Arthrobacter polaris]
MILQAGFNLTQLAQPLIRRHGRNKDRLVLILATGDLELIRAGILTKHFSGRLAQHMDTISMTAQGCRPPWTVGTEH